MFCCASPNCCPLACAFQVSTTPGPFTALWPRLLRPCPPALLLFSAEGSKNRVDTGALTLTQFRVPYLSETRPSVLPHPHLTKSQTEFLVSFAEPGSGSDETTSLTLNCDRILLESSEKDSRPLLAAGRNPTGIPTKARTSDPDVTDRPKPGPRFQFFTPLVPEQYSPKRYQLPAN